MDPRDRGDRIRALRRACLNCNAIGCSPLAAAVRMKSWLRTSSIVARVNRA